MAVEIIKVVINITISIHICCSTLVVLSDNTKSAEFEITTKVVIFENPTKVGRIFF
jgi:hypothetical protein